MSPQPAAVNQTSVEIEGSPAFEGRRLTPGDLPPVGASELDSWIALARRIRGQFSIIAKKGDTSIAVTDLSGSYPVFLNSNRAGDGFATSLESVTRGSGCAISGEGLSRYLAFGSVGAGCNLVAGVSTLPGASVTIRQGTSTSTTGWFDWMAATQVSRAPVEELEEEFRSIMTSWGKTYLPKEGRVGLLLSAGTDSGLLTALMKPLLGDRLVCFTQDFFSARYSERAGAVETAERVGVPIVTVPIRRRDYFRAIRKLNSAGQDTAVHQAEAYNMYCLADFAKQQGVDTLITGYNADYLFLGMEHFHAGLRGREDYEQAASRLSAEERVERVMGPVPRFTSLTQELLDALHVPLSEYNRQVNEVRNTRQELLTPLARAVELITLQQLSGQIDGGIAWQDEHGCLGVMRALPGCSILCPFYDSEIIRFALRLPVDLLFNEGRNKYLLRKVLKAETGLERPKRPASMSPARLWRMLFNFEEYSSLSPELKKLYLRLSAQNFFAKGRLSQQLTTTAALGVWLKSHHMGAA